MYIFNVLFYVNDFINIEYFEKYLSSLSDHQKITNIYSLMFMLYMLLYKKKYSNPTKYLLPEIKSNPNLNILFEYHSKYNDSDLYYKLKNEKFDIKEYSKFKISKLIELSKNSLVKVRYEILDIFLRLLHIESNIIFNIKNNTINTKLIEEYKNNIKDLIVEIDNISNKSNNNIKNLYEYSRLLNDFINLGIFDYRTEYNKLDITIKDYIKTTEETIKSI